MGYFDRLTDLDRLTEDMYTAWLSYGVKCGDKEAVNAEDTESPVNHNKKAAIATECVDAEKDKDDDGKDSSIVNKKDKYGKIALHYAGKCKNAEVVQMLIDQDPSTVKVKDKYGRIPLYYASMYGSAEVVQKLIDQDPSTVGIKGKCGKLPLHYASMCGNAEVVQMLINKNPSTVNTKGKNGRTPLCYAIHVQSKETIEVLINNGADAKSVADICGDAEDPSTLDNAVRAQNTETGEVLIKNENGADVKSVADICGDAEDPSTLGNAVRAQNTETGEVLIKNGAENGADAKSVADICGDAEAVSTQDTDGRVKLYDDVKYGNEEAVNTAAIATFILVAVATPLVLSHFTMLSTPAIIGITILSAVASAIAVGTLVNKVSDWLSEPELNPHASQAQDANLAK